MKNKIFNLIAFVSLTTISIAQSNPIITQWIQNHSGITGRHYVQGNSTPIIDNVLANVQNVDYSTNWVYVSATGIPSYITGPFTDGNPSLAEDQNAIYKLPLNPTQNTGNSTSTFGGNIGVFINGVSLFDYRDGVAWDNSTNALCGGPGNPPCPGGPQATQSWNRDAIPAEMGGFDCAKAHPAMGNYHHHQNPSAFDLDLLVVSNICDSYPADGLYVIDINSHSPLIGFAYDGFPIYGAYAYANIDGSGGIVRMKSGYSLRNINTRTNGPNVGQIYTIPNGPNAGNQEVMDLGYFREDYEFISNSGSDYLDSHNGRFAVTPEYPSGTYAYYTTVDENHNSAYPYAVGPIFYGNVVGTSVDTINETTTNYDSSLTINTFDFSSLNLVIYPNPSQDFIAIQSNLLENNLKLELINEIGQLVLESTILQGSTLSIIETYTLYNGIYFLKVSYNKNTKTYKIIINK
ncbi:MAG: YHYH protein [Flavobacteriaceae bacterium]|nr:YHYH protein [Flavobacteriaceae bacterium]